MKFILTLQRSYACWLAIGLASLFVAPQHLCGQEDEKQDVDVEALLEEAGSALQSQDWEAAAKAFKKVVKADKENGRAWHLLGYSLHSMGKLEEAIPIHEKASKFEDFKGISLYNLGCAYSLTGKKQKAISFLHKSLDAGFDQFDTIEQDSDLDNVRKAKGYQDIVARIENDGQWPKFETKKMVGKWKIVKGVRAGKDVAGERLPSISITDESIEIPAGPEKFVMSYQVKTDKNPAEVDMAITAGPAPEGSKAVGLIRMRAGNLVLCYDSTGEKRPKNFKSTEENGYFLFVLKPEAESKKQTSEK